MASRGRGKNEKSAPRVRRVEQIELSERHIILRIVFVGLFLALAVAGFAIGIKNVFGVPKGWREISPTGLTASAAGVSEEITLTYYVGRGSASAAKDNRNVTALYRDALNEADRIYDARTVNGMNLAFLNANPNKWVAVDPALRASLLLIAETDCRNVWLGALSEIYYDLFFRPDGSDLSEYDPAINPALGEICADLAAFARDPASVGLSFKGDSVMLTVSDEYAAFAAENGIDAYLDLFWMRNAFIVDYVAASLTANGYSAGYITTVDGFSRNLARDETEFAFRIFDPDGTTVRVAGELIYSGATSFVRFKSYCFPSDPDWLWVAGDDGVVRHPYLSTADGTPRAAISDLVGFSRTGGCAETALRLTPVFTAGELTPSALAALTGAGIGYVYTRDLVVHVNSAEVTVTNLFESEDAVYTVTKD